MVYKALENKYIIWRYTPISNYNFLIRLNLLGPSKPIPLMTRNRP